VMFMALMELGGPSSIAMEKIRSHTQPTMYILYLHLARRTTAFAQKSPQLYTLSHQLKQSASTTLPPESIMDWLKSQPPSSTVELLLEKSSQGHLELSAYIMNEMQDKDMRALASLSMASISDEVTHEEAQEDRSAMDDLLFFESTEGDGMRVFPDWEDSASDIEITMDESDDSQD